MLFFKKKIISHLDTNKLPQHVGIIMDGNGRWAKKRGMPRFLGHREGVKSVKKNVRYASDIGIKYLTIYTFSTENWKRPQKEVSFLMNLLVDALNNEFDELYKKNVKIEYIGINDNLPDKVLKVLNDSVEKTKNNSGLVLNLALNYGSRLEITDSVRAIANKLLNGKITIDEVNEDLISQHLYAPHIPDPDLIIRTANEHRLSNFLLWQSAYSEFYFTDVLWPNFRENHFKEALIDYQNRTRRFGGVVEE